MAAHRIVLHWRWITAGVLTALSVLGALHFSGPGSFSDFSVFWVAAQHPVVAYDFHAMTVAQSWLQRSSERPFVYPPTFLLLLSPMRGVAWRIAFTIWVAASTFAFVAVQPLTARRSWIAVFLLSLSSAVVIADLRGQPTLLVGALLTVGVASITTRPGLAGVLLAAAVLLKPQSAIMAPIALIATREWRALGSAALFSSCLVALSVIVLGPAAWTEWLADLPRFQALTQAMGGIVAPSRLFPPQFQLAACLLLAMIGAVITATTFCLSDRLELRLGALAGGSMMCSPYVGFYDMAILAPAALQLIWPRDKRAWPLSIAAAALLLHPFPTPWALLGATLAAPALAMVDRYRPAAMLGSPAAVAAAGGPRVTPTGVGSTTAKLASRTSAMDLALAAASVDGRIGGPRREVADLGDI